MKKNRELITWFTALLVSAVLVFAIACGGGGGGDTAPNSAVEGNVSEQLGTRQGENASIVARMREALKLVQLAYAAVDGVQVSIRGTGLQTVTDDTGFFRLEGDFAGDVVLDFTLENATVSLSLNVPAGTTVLIQDVTVNVTTGEAVPSQTVVMENSPSPSASPNGSPNPSPNPTPGDGNSNSGGGANTNSDDGGNTNSGGDGNTNTDGGNSNSNSGGDSNSNSGGGDNNSNGGDDDNSNSGGGGNSGSGGGDDNSNDDDDDDDDNDNS